MHETVADLQCEGLISKATMREFDELCLEPVIDLGPAEISAIRKSAKVSQTVFGKFLNVGKSTVSQWERGERKPDGTALKLLNLAIRVRDNLP